jgi:predicted CXXCH cytochrome family protein
MATSRNSELLLLALLLTALTCAAPGHAQALPKNSCLECHGILPEPLLVTPESFAADIHAQKGLTCASCHGGNPALDDADVSMSRAAGFKGKIARTQVPALCASCHADGAYMRQFNPSLRTDQLSQYRTSVHGQLLSRGNDKVAVCTDCHGLHGIRPASDSRSQVHPTNVATTCSKCHADAEYMKGFSIPTDQFASYSASVHHDALAVRGDLSAPTCTTCHGNHGAAPPGVAAVENVCATCHVFQAQLFDTSRHKTAFADLGLPGCVTCHSNHRIQRPSDEMIGTTAKAVCITCHSDGDPGFAAAANMREQLDGLVQAIHAAEAALDRAEQSGMEISEAKLNQSQARDALTKARVTIHSFQPGKVAEDIQAGLKVASANHQAGLDALAERDYRRVGLAVSLLAIVAVLIGLRLYIRKIESPT